MCFLWLTRTRAPATSYSHRISINPSMCRVSPASKVLVESCSGTLAVKRGYLKMTCSRTLRVALGVILATAIGMASGVVLSGSPSASSGQGSQDNFLNQRLRILEQRLYSIETSINQLQQSVSSQRATAAPSGGRDSEIIGLRSQVDTFNRRLIEIECGLLKLDERTSTPATREALKRLGDSSKDPCRINASAPLRLSSRP